MSLLKQLAGETVIYGIGQILPRIVHYLVFSIYLTYRLNDDPGEYAIYVDLYAYASILIVLFSYRMDTAFFRFATKAKDLNNAFKTAFLPLVGSSVLLILIGTLLASPLASFLKYPGRSIYVIWFAWIIAFDVLSLLPLAKLRLQSKAKIFVGFKVLNVFMTIALVLFFLEFCPRFWPGVLSFFQPYVHGIIDYVFISNLTASVVMFLGLLLYVKLPKGNIDWSLWKDMLQYSWPLVIVGIAGSINQFFGVPLQKFFLGADFELNREEAGIYGAIQKIPALLAMVTTAYNYAAEPFFFRNASRKDSKDLYGRVAQCFIIVIGFVALGIYLYIDLFQYFVGSTYRKGLYLIPVLLLSYVFLGIYYNISVWYKLSGKTIYGAIIASIGALLTLVVSITFLPIIGISASAYAALGCYSLMVILAYFLGQKHYPINYPVVPMLRQIGMIILIMFVFYLVKTEEIVYNLVIASCLIIAYAVMTYFLEKELIKSFFSKES